jgi:hypothetical protein
MTSTETGSEQSFLLQRVQPAMTGLIDGSLSTLAPIFTRPIISPAASLPMQDA